MMQVGFVSAILADRSFDEVMRSASVQGYECVEIMCWPVGKAERRYAGVTHIDVSRLTKRNVDAIHWTMHNTGVAISALGYYPNILEADRRNSSLYVRHLKKVIEGAALLGVPVVNTFIGRDHRADIETNFQNFLKIWPPIVKLAEKHKIRLCIENCPMFFSQDEWPGGKNLANTPDMWQRMFKAVPSRYFGLNYDPSHLIWQMMDYINPIYEFKNRIFHVHIKDAKLQHCRLNRVGILANPLQFHQPKLPGLGDVEWGAFFSALTDIGYSGATCVEVEDRAYEGSLKSRERALLQSRSYLRQYLP